MTKKQAEVLGFIREFIATHGYSPSLVEIAAAVGSQSGSVYRIVNRLEARGLVKRCRGWRNISVVEGGVNAKAA